LASGESIVIILLALHIGFIAVWAGAAAILSSVILPSLGRLSAGTRAEFSLATLPLFARFIAITSTGAVVAGILLFGFETRVATAYAPDSLGTAFIGAGAGLGLIAYILAIGVAYPTSNKIVKLLKQAKAGENAQGSPEIPRLQTRMRMVAGAVSGLLAITLILMVIGATV